MSTDTVLEKKTKTVIGPPPKMFNVVILNNANTQQEFVVDMLSKVFNMNAQIAINKMYEVHLNKRTNVGPFTKEIAETKKDQCLAYAAKAQKPQNRELVTIIEPAP